MVGTKRKQSADNPDARRQRLEAPADESFCAGNVEFMRVQNFMSHSSLEVTPGPGLNFVLGPNGAGKSALMCALVLCLGGTPTMLDRGKDVGSFVQYGKAEAMIEVRLAHGNPDGSSLKISRLIKRGGTSNFWMNDRGATQKSVVTSVRKLGIQIDNLCHFMMQKKVADFAKVVEPERLRMVEKAVGPPDLLAQHDELIAMQSKALETKLHVVRGQAKLDQLERENEKIKADKVRFELRAEYVEQVRLMKLKRPWLETYDARERYVALKEDVQQAKHAADVAKKALEVPSQAFEAMEKHVKKVREVKEANAATVRHAKGVYRRELVKSEDLQGKEEEVSQALKYALRETDNHQKKIRNAEKALEMLKARSAGLRPVDDVQKEEAEIRRKLRELQVQLNRITRESNTAEEQKREALAEERRCSRRVEKLESVREQRLAALQDQIPDAVDVYRWVQNNPQAFRGKVYGPVPLEIQVDPLYADYVGHVLPRWLRPAFIVTEKEDRETLSNYLYGDGREARMKRVPLIHVQRQQQARHPDDLTTARMNELGFVGWLDDVLRVPDPVMSVLRKSALVDSAAIGSPQIERRLSEVFRTTNVRTVLVPGSAHSARRSRFGAKEMMEQSVPIPRSAIFQLQSNPESVTEAQRELAFARDALDKVKQKLKDCQSREDAVRMQEQPLVTRKDELARALRESRTVVRQIATQEANLKTLQQVRDAQELERQARRDLGKASSKRIAHADTVLRVCQAWIDATIEVDKTDGELSDAEISLRQKRRELVALERARDDALVILTRTQKTEEAAKVEWKNLRDVAREGVELTEEIKTKFRQLPETLVALDERIVAIQTKIDAIYQNDPRIIWRFEERQREIDALQRQQNQIVRSNDEQEGAMAKIRELWFPVLEDLIRRLNASFSSHMAAVGVAGVCQLGQVANYADWRLELMAQFRDESQLQRLQLHELSGGERSLVTALFICALQSLAPTPLRVADELNQGMDRHNERAAIARIEEASRLEPHTQYFLVSPKLLQDLEFVEKTTILIVCAGPWLVKSSEWREAKELSA